jgi:hypothetical protein
MKKVWWILIGIIVIFLVLGGIKLYRSFDAVTGVEVFEEHVSLEILGGDSLGSGVEDGVKGFEWIDEDTLEVRTAITMVCGCEILDWAGFNIKGLEIVLEYGLETGDIETCADCAFPIDVRFRLDNITKQDYYFTLERTDSEDMEQDPETVAKIKLEIESMFGPE